METGEALQWIKHQELFELAKRHSNVFKKVLTNALGIRDERILIIGDTGAKGSRLSAVISSCYYLAADEMSIPCKLVLQKAKTRGQIAEEDVVRSLSSLDEKSIAILNMSDTLGSISQIGKSFRKFAKKNRFRFISTPSLGNISDTDVQNIIDAVDIDYRIIRSAHDKVREKFDSASRIRIKSKGGTELECGVQGIKSEAADGNYSEPGTGGNIPPGEVYIAPNGKDVSGKFVIDGSIRTRHKTLIPKDPVILTIADGSITDISGGSEADELKKTLEWAASVSKHQSSVYRIGEVGIGLNPKAKIIGATIIDEKTVGSAHIAIGSNYWFGGSIYSKIHLDQVCKEATVYIDGQKLEY